MSGAVTICIPAYGAEAFLAETIDSALAQTWSPVDVLVSVDAAGDRTAEIAERYAGRGVRVVVRPERVGWVRNVNAALAAVNTPFAMILPHDDLLHPRFLAACMAALAADSDAVLAYPDLRFGRFSAMQQPSVIGTVEARMEAFLRGHFDAVAFRGVFERRRAPRHEVPDFAIANYAADTLWVARLLGQGGMVRVPQVLYRKRLRKTSVHAVWKDASHAELDEMWIVHCVELERIIREAAAWNDELEAAWEARLLRSRNRGLRQRRSVLDPTKPLRAQAESVYARVRDRTPHYSWAASSSGTASAK
jgi:glycosyltransferase involved in cell wall biosynthesis